MSADACCIVGIEPQAFLGSWPACRMRRGWQQLQGEVVKELQDGRAEQKEMGRDLGEVSLSMELQCGAGTDAEVVRENGTAEELGAGVANGGAVVEEGGNGDGTADGEEAGTGEGRNADASGEGGVGSLGLEEGAWIEGGPVTASTV